MALSDGTKNFWVQVLSFWALAGVVILTANLWLGWRWAIAVALAMFVVFMGLLAQVKTAILAAMPDDWPGEQTTVANCPWLDVDWLAQVTTDFKTLGFQPLADYRLKDSAAFARCWFHPEHQCFAECAESYNAAGDRLCRQVIILSLLAEDWSVVHLNRAFSPDLDSVARLWWHPHKLGIYCPAITLAELLEKHLHFRAKLMAKTETMLSDRHSWDDYVAHETAQHLDRKRQLQRTNLLLGMMQVLWVELRPPHAWLGDYIH